MELLTFKDLCKAVGKKFNYYFLSVRIPTYLGRNLLAGEITHADDNRLRKLFPALKGAHGYYAYIDLDKGTVNITKVYAVDAPSYVTTVTFDRLPYADDLLTKLLRKELEGYL